MHRRANKQSRNCFRSFPEQNTPFRLKGRNPKPVRNILKSTLVLQINTPSSRRTVDRIWWWIRLILPSKLGYRVTSSSRPQYRSCSLRWLRTCLALAHIWCWGARHYLPSFVWGHNKGEDKILAELKCPAPSLNSDYWSNSSCIRQRLHRFQVV